MHISKGKPTENATKVWLTKVGTCILANNSSKIPNSELNRILDVITINYFRIVSKWKEVQGIENIKFYC